MQPFLAGVSSQHGRPNVQDNEGGLFNTPTFMLEVVAVKKLKVRAHQMLVGAPQSGREYQIIDVPASALVLHRQYMLNARETMAGSAL